MRFETGFNKGSCRTAETGNSITLLNEASTAAAPKPRLPPLTKATSESIIKMLRLGVGPYFFETGADQTLGRNLNQAGNFVSSQLVFAMLMDTPAQLGRFLFPFQGHRCRDNLTRHRILSARHHHFGDVFHFQQHAFHFCRKHLSPPTLMRSSWRPLMRRYSPSISTWSPVSYQPSLSKGLGPLR